MGLQSEANCEPRSASTISNSACATFTTRSSGSVGMFCHSSGCMAPPRISSFVLCCSSKPREKMAVEPVQIFDRVADSEARMQIEQKVSVSERPREIQQHRALVARACKAARPDSRRPSLFPRRLWNPSPRSTFRRPFPFACAFLREARQNFPQRLRGYRLGNEILHAAAHGIQQHLGIRRIRGGAGDQTRRRAASAAACVPKAKKAPDRAPGRAEQCRQ